MVIELTADHIERLKTANGGWTRAAFELMGEAWPPVPGWKNRVIGRMVDAGALSALIARVDPKTKQS